MCKIAFIEDWKKLIPMGYKFQRLYGGNHICYHKIDLDLWIWKKSKSLMIKDLYGKSYIVLQYLIDNDFTLHKFNRIVIDVIDNRAEEYNAEKHELIFRYKTMTEKEIDDHIERYRVVTFKQETLDELKALYTQGFISIQQVEKED